MATWKEISSDNLTQLEELAREFSIHPLVIEDCIHRNQRAKLENFEGHQFLVWFMVTNGESYELQFIILPSTLVLVPHDKPPEGLSWKEFFRIDDSPKDVWHMIYQALDRASDATTHDVKYIAGEIDDFESNIFSQKFEPKSVLTVKRRLGALEYSVEHLPSVAKQLQNFYPGKDDLRWKWRDLFDHTERTFRKVSYLRDQIGATIELYWGHQAHKTNLQIKKLSTLASVAVPLTFWASFWGMNFEALPFASRTFFHGALLVMAISAGVALWLLVRRGYWDD